MAMDTIDIAVMIAVLATLLTLVGDAPQIRRLRRTGDTNGVSLSTAMLAVAAESGWFIYLAGEHLWSAVPETVITIGFNAVFTADMVRAGARWGAPIAGAAAWAVALVGARLSGGPAAIAVLLSVTYAVQMAPAVWTVWRTWCPSGVSPGAWSVRLVQSALWAGYGQLRENRPLLILGVIGSLASTAVLVRLVVTRYRRALAVPIRTTPPAVEPRRDAAPVVPVFLAAAIPSDA